MTDQMTEIEDDRFRQQLAEKLPTRRSKKKRVELAISDVIGPEALAESVSKVPTAETTDEQVVARRKLVHSLETKAEIIRNIGKLKSMGIDIKAEYERIQMRQSTLPTSLRKTVEYLFKQYHSEELANV